MAMNRPRIVSQAEWRGARKALLAEEKEFTRQRDTLNAERRRLPMVRVDKDYVFESPHGPARLVDLFEGRQQLIVYHFMFDPSWDAGCPSCSFLTDNIGHLAHLHARKTTLALVSRAPLKKIDAYRNRMGPGAGASPESGHRQDADGHCLPAARGNRRRARAGRGTRRSGVGAGVCGLSGYRRDLAQWNKDCARSAGGADRPDPSGPGGCASDGVFGLGAAFSWTPG